MVLKENEMVLLLEEKRMEDKGKGNAYRELTLYNPHPILVS